MKRYCFTRVDLVCVAGCAMILAALIVPVAGRATARSGSDLCLGQLARLNLGLTGYAADNADYFPAGSPPSHEFEWASRVAPYVGVKQEPDAPAAAFVCPEDRASALLTYKDLLARKSSYGINGYGVSWNHQTRQGVRRAQVQNPDMIVLTDANGWLVVGYAGEGAGRIPVPRHDGGKAVNVLYFDGRAESVPVEVKKPADMYNEGNLSSDYWYRNI